MESNGIMTYSTGLCMGSKCIHEIYPVESKMGKHIVGVLTGSKLTPKGAAQVLLPLPVARRTTCYLSFGEYHNTRAQGEILLPIILPTKYQHK